MSRIISDGNTLILKVLTRIGLCTTISIDALFVMYAIGGAMLGWFGMKSWKKYNDRSKNTDTKPAATEKVQSFTTDGN